MNKAKQSVEIGRDVHTLDDLKHHLPLGLSAMALDSDGSQVRRALDYLEILSTGAGVRGNTSQRCKPNRAVLQGTHSTRGVSGIWATESAS